MSTERSYNPMSMNGICPVCKKNPGKLMLNQYGPCSSCVPIPISTPIPAPSGAFSQYKYRWALNDKDYVAKKTEQIADARFALQSSVEWVIDCLNSGVVLSGKPPALISSTREWGVDSVYSWSKDSIIFKDLNLPRYYIIKEQMYG